MARTRTSEPLRGAFIAIVAAAIGAIGTLGGNALSNANAQNLLAHDDKVRQDDLRRAAYQGFASTAFEFVIDIQFVSVIEEINESTLKRDVQEITKALSAVLLAGSPEATDLAQSINDELIGIGNEMVEGLDPAKASDKAGEVAVAVLDFITIGREELNE